MHDEQMTEQVRNGYGWSGHDSIVESNREFRRAEFDTWFAAEIAAAKAEERERIGSEITNQYIARSGNFDDGDFHSGFAYGMGSAAGIAHKEPT